jgi:uncharacterized surface protein with fasciclin (FAS1) repeats
LLNTGTTMYQGQLDRRCQVKILDVEVSVSTTRGRIKTNSYIYRYLNHAFNLISFLLLGSDREIKKNKKIMMKIIFFLICCLLCYHVSRPFELFQQLPSYEHRYQKWNAECCCFRRIRLKCQLKQQICTKNPTVVRTRLYGTTANELSPTIEIEQYLQSNHDLFWKFLLSNNEYVWTKVRDCYDTGGCTIFAPTNAAMELLGTQKLQQLQDARNDEVRIKIGTYHVVVNDIVSADQLYDSAGIRTIATGDNPIVPMERTVTGGLFGMGGKEDGTVTIGSGAHIINTVRLDNSNCIIHQTDALISPNILWRYCDQLRIPGSK